MAVQAERYTISLLVSAPATGAPQGVVRIPTSTGSGYPAEGIWLGGNLKPPTANAVGVREIG